jgi:hypothetical protein
MDNYWTFKVFVDEKGFDVIAKWRKDLPLKDKEKIRLRLAYMKTIKIWEPPLIKKLQGKKYDPIYEIRISGNKVEYRPLGFYGPGEKDFTLVIGARKKSGKRGKPSWEPPEARETAKRRYELIQQDRNKYIGEYNEDQQKINS